MTLDYTADQVDQMTKIAQIVAPRDTSGDFDTDRRMVLTALGDGAGPPFDRIIKPIADLVITAARLLP